ncbi:ribosomal protein S18-alanine N-acetyltransferase [Actinomadura alba]|uniref:Ribosomal protein S18-alanine N-acetyltransferase n=2 Tax=Actinomadura alba TaxID=406431 RepID=A0ABR7LJA8_9ACTN|nr:ribosomal protein S18-alanine N-acetyltransferase [Actinomadura alba]
MTPDDLPVVQRLEALLYPDDAWSTEMFRSELADQAGTRHYVVAVAPPESSPPAAGATEEIVGYAGLAAAGGQGDVQTIGVRSDRRGRGIGAALLTALLDEAARRDCEVVFLEVRADNEAARKLYERFGFTEISVRKRYYQPSGVDAIVMCRQSTPPRKRTTGFGPVGGADE